MAIDALSLLEDGLRLYRRTFRRDLWRYYLASMPLATALFWTWQLNWPADSGARFGLIQLAALLLTACAVLRILGVGVYGRCVLAELTGVRSLRRAPSILSEFWVSAILVLLWWLSLPFLLGIGLFYAAVQYVPLLQDRCLRRSLNLAHRIWLQLWPLLGLVLLFGALVFCNLAVTVLLLPPVLHALFGLGGTLGFAAVSAFLFRSSLFWFALALVTYLLLDPVIKCALTISFQRLQSVREGVDLAAAVRRLEPKAAGKAAFALRPWSEFVLGLAVPFSQAQAGLQPNAAILQRAIQSELQRPVYAWQHPRPAPTGHGISSALARLLDFVLNPLVFLGRWLAKGVAAIGHWLARWFRASPAPPAAGASGHGWERWELALAALFLLLLFGLVLVRQRRRRASPAGADLQPARVDVANASAIDQNEGEWFALSARLQESGQWRLALRAAFLGGLAGLGQRRLVTLRRDRTNREYFEEFSRRVAMLPSGASADDLRLEFGNAVRDFNQAWYGGHHVDLARLNDFVAAQRRLLSHV